jgi:glycosyltransferase involved in cell wall biosynthesis
MTLQSILQAEESSLLREIVVVDDGSTDETRSIVESFGERVCYERTERKGPAIARNHGAGHASASHVLFFDDDLIVPANYLRDLKRIHQSVACDWIAGNIKTASTLPDSSFVRFLKDSDRQRPQQAKFIESIMEGSFTAANLLVEKKTFLELGGFPPDYYRACCEDMDLGEQALKTGLRIWYAPELVVEHYDHNLLDFEQFAERQYHGCVAHAQFFARYPHLQSQSALAVKVLSPPATESPLQRLRRSLQKGLAANPIRGILLKGASIAGRAPIPERVKWLLFRASISSQMFAGFSWGTRRVINSPEKSKSV